MVPGTPCNFVQNGHASLSINTLQLFPKRSCKKHAAGYGILNAADSGKVNAEMSGKVLAGYKYFSISIISLTSLAFLLQE